MTKITVINSVPKVESTKVKKGEFRSFDLKKEHLAGEYIQSKMFTEFLQTIDDCKGMCTVEFYLEDQTIIRLINCEFAEDANLIKLKMENKWPEVFPKL